MKKAAGLCLIFSLLFLAGCKQFDKKKQTNNIKPGEQTECRFERKVVKIEKLPYLLYLPKDYKNQKTFPCILFLHGAGERGDELTKLKEIALPGILENEDLPFIVISPQCPEEKWWTDYNETLILLLDHIIENYKADPAGVYLTGLSMGGFGSWSLACEFPERFAAVAPICGGGDANLARRKLKNTPVWAFHGGKDKAVPLYRSEEMVEAMKQAGGNARLTVYPQIGHDAWTTAYNDPKLYKWFLENRLNKKK